MRVSFVSNTAIIAGLFICQATALVVKESKVLLDGDKNGFKRFTGEDAGKMGQKDLQSGQKDMSTECSRDLGNLVTALDRSLWINYTRGDPFSFLMVDSWGKPQSGYLDGDSVWEGSYLQCIRAKDDYLLTNIAGKMCITEWRGPRGIDGIGLCVPDTCNETDVYAFLRDGYIGLEYPELPPGYETRLNTSTTFCVTQIDDKDIFKDASAIAAISVLLFFVLLAIIGTIYDLATMELRRDSENYAQPQRKVFPEYRIPRPSFTGSSSGEGNWTLHGVNTHTQQYENRAYESKPELPPAHTIPQGFISYPPPDYSDRNRLEDPAHYANNWNRPQQQLPPRMRLDDAPPQQEPWEPDTCGKICLAFSIRQNARYLLNFDAPRGSIKALNGIRFLAFAWIVLGHTWTLGVTESKSPTIANKEALERLGPGFRATQFVIKNSSYSAESFFILTALLVTVSFMKKLKESKPDCEMVGVYFFHRFWRLTPLYMMVLMAYGCLFNYVGAGPFYRGPELITDASNCKKYFWKHLLYLNNLIDVNANTECMSWTWYIANDFQFYVISPAFLFSLYYVPAFGIVLSVLAICGGLAANIYLAHRLQFDTGSDALPAVDAYFEIYIKPWCRCTTYFMGMILGFVLWRCNFKSRMNKVGVAFAWILFLALSCTIMYAEWNWQCQGCSPWPERAYVAFESLKRTFFGLFVCWTIYACVTGYGGFINSLLSWKGWLPLSRLSYAGYLFHPILIYYYYYQRPTQFYVNDMDMVFLYCGVMILSLGASFLLSLFIEVPLLALEKVMFANTPRNRLKRQRSD